MTKDEVLQLVKSQLRNCAGWEGDEIALDRVSALDYYLQRQRGDEIPGRSTTVAGDVSASVEANLAQMLDAFSSDNIIEFDPLGLDDEEQSKLESDTVVHFVMKSQNGFVQLAAAIKDALLLRNGVMKVWVDEFSQTRTRTFDNVAPEAADALAAREGAEVVSYSDETLRLRKKIVYKKFRAEAVAMENFFYPKLWDSFDLQACPFVAERHIDTRSELIRMGFKKAQVAELKAYTPSANNAAAAARNVGSTVPPVAIIGDKSQDLIEWFECYVLADVDDDGIAERRCVAFVWNEGEVLADEPCSIVPYAIGAVMLMPHRVTGISQYDKLRQTQDEHTGLKRALYDNVNAATKNRLAVLGGKVNQDDLSDGRSNGVVRTNAASQVEDIRAAVMPLAVQDNSANILANIEALKRERSELGGSALDMQSASVQIGGDRMGSQGLDRAYSVMEQLAAMMTKNVAATLIRNTFLLAHAVLRESFDEPVQIKRDGKWDSPVPSQWQPRNRITVKVGMSPGERARQAATLRQIMADHIQLAQLGMDEVLTNSAVFFKTAMAWARVSDIRNPEQFYVDPQSPDAQKALQFKTQVAQQQAAEQKALVNRAVGNEETKTALDKYKHDSSLQHEYFKDVMHSDEVEAQVVGKATVDLLKAREDGINRAKSAGPEPASEPAADAAG